MASVYYLPDSVQNFLVSSGLVTAEHAALERSTALDYVPPDLLPTVFGMCVLSDQEAQMAVQQALLQSSVDQIDLNNAAEKIWATREKIMKAQWPSDATEQQVIRDLLAADVTSGVPADPPTPPLTQAINTDAAATIEATLAAQQKTADAVLDKLNAYAATGETMVDWPTDPSTEAEMATWLKAQGVSDTDLSTDSYWVSGLDDTVVDIADVTTTITFNADFPAYSADEDASDYSWVRKLSSDDSELLAWNGTSLLQVTSTEHVDDRSYNSLDDDGIVVLAWNPPLKNLTKTSGTIYTATKDGVETKYFVPDSTTLGIIVPDDIGKAYDVDGTTVRLWSDGTDIYTVDTAEMTYNPSRPKETKNVLSGLAGHGPLSIFKNNGLDSRTDVSPVITSVDGTRRATWADVFEKKINTLQTNTSTFTSSVSTSNTQIQETLTYWNVAANWITNQLKVWADALKTYSSKL